MALPAGATVTWHSTDTWYDDDDALYWRLLANSGIELDDVAGYTTGTWALPTIGNLHGLAGFGGEIHPALSESMWAAEPTLGVFTYWMEAAGAEVGRYTMTVSSYPNPPSPLVPYTQAFWASDETFTPQQDSEYYAGLLLCSSSPPSDAAPRTTCTTS